MDKFTNILLAEDDSSDYEFFVEALEKISATFKITWAKNGLDCMAFLKTNKPDIIFLDLNMPGYNGRDCLKFIKDNETLAEVPVVIYSTSHYIKDIDACFKTGAHFYIVKPADQNLLGSCLERVMAQLSNTMEQPDKQNFVVGVSTAMES
ncbi:MAG: response regulator [Segetibacter sp.]|nr:response regulator [Segetibacter sp.]